MKPLELLICDDEPPARRRLARLLESIEGTEVVGEAAHGFDALEKIEALSPSVVLLDISMPELDGLEVAEAVQAKQGGPSIVFTTAHEEHAARAFDFAAVDYLLKPIRLDRLRVALDRCRARSQTESRPAMALPHLREQLGMQPARLALKSGARHVLVSPSDIQLISAEDHYAVVRTAQGEHLCDPSLDTLEKRLGQADFLRVHRSAIVRLSAVRELVCEGDRRYFLVMSDESSTRVPISRDRLPDVKRALGVG